MAFVAPVDDLDGRRLGGVAIVAPPQDVATELADGFGDRSQFTLALVDDASGTALSVGEGLDDTGDPMGDAGFITAARPVAATTWSVHAGADPSSALQPARSALVHGAVLAVAVLLVLLLALAVVNRRIAEPLRRLTALVRDPGPMAHAALGAISGPTEIARLGNAFQSAIEARDRFEAMAAEHEFHDVVTGLPNRALLSERLGLSLERAA